MPKRYKSKAMEAVHETMRGLRAADAISDARMKEFDDMCIEASKAESTQLSFTVYQDKRDEWRWRLVASNGKVIATSSEGYADKRDCLHAITLVKSASGAKVAA